MSLYDYLKNTQSERFKIVRRFTDGGVNGNPNPKDPKEWVRNWYANRQLQNSNDNAYLQSIKPDLLKSIDTLPQYMLRDSKYMSNGSETVGVSEGAPANGMYEHDTHTVSILDDLYNNQQDYLPLTLDSLLVHEYSHGVDMPNTNLLSKINSKGMESIKKLSDYKNADKLDEGRKKYINYLTKPTEVSSRLMQLRYDMDLKPDEIVTPERVKKYIEENSEKLDTEQMPDYIYEIFDYIKNRKNMNDINVGIANFLNKFVSTDTNKQSPYSQYLKTIKNA